MQSSDGQIIDRAATAQKESKLTARFHDGEVSLRTEN
jgi:exonuclease VII large subunit